MNKTSNLSYRVWYCVLIMFILSACSVSSENNSSMTTQTPAIGEESGILNDGAPLDFTVDPENLLPCGTFETMRLLQPSQTIEDPVHAIPTIVQNATELEIPAMRSAPTEDHIGFPDEFATQFKLLFVFDRPDRRLVRAICGNDIAAQHKNGEPFAYGSILLMITYSAKLDDIGLPILDKDGNYIRENFVAYHVMRKEKGFGKEYGDDRAGEWEFVGYNEDGSYETRPENSNFCATCHKVDAGESVDWVFRMNLFHDGDEAYSQPIAKGNEIPIYLYSFPMKPLEITAGSTVTWINDDQAAHIIMAAMENDQGKIVADPNVLFASEILPSVTIDSGASFSYTFEQPGEYLYICTIHANMVGKIIVK